jgi:thiol-disulfide isomerase/thioredoxin
MPLLLMLLVIWGCFIAVKSATAKAPVVYAVLFYSPTCSHCAKLDREVLPQLQEKYGNRLVIFRLNVISAAGNRIYDKALQRFNVTENRIGVPTIVIGETFLVGTVEIPEKLPGLIDAAISRGGLDLPDLPGLYKEFVAQSNLHLEDLSVWQLMVYKFRQDQLANGIAVFLLVIMIASLITALIITLTQVKAPRVLNFFPAGLSRFWR